MFLQPYLSPQWASLASPSSEATTCPRSRVQLPGTALCVWGWDPSPRGPHPFFPPHSPSPGVLQSQLQGSCCPTLGWATAHGMCDDGLVGDMPAPSPVNEAVCSPGGGCAPWLLGSTPWDDVSQEQAGCFLEKVLLSIAIY